MAAEMRARVRRTNHVAVPAEVHAGAMSLVDQLTAAYVAVHKTPKVRVPAVRSALREYVDAGSAVLRGVKERRKAIELRAYLGRLYVLRSQSMPRSAWKLSLLAWLKDEPQLLLGTNERLSQRT